jgi:Putative prokaryotic signal transducing protein
MTTYAGGRPMVELLRSNDHVLLSFVAALCEDHGIATLLADSNISVMEGSIGAFPRRLLVDAERHHHARELLAEADSDLDD